MDKTSVNFRISGFRHRVFAWIVLFFLSWSFLPAVSIAQQPTATMSAVSGTVLVNGQTQGTGTVLSAGDVIETQAGARVVLDLSDGSLLELGENTKLDIAELSQTATGARVSRVKMAWGWIRARLSPGHQKEGSKFDIETPNAIVGVKFSEPDVEVSYSLEKAETVGIAHTVELIAKNLLTDEEILVPVGSTVIIVGTTVKIVAGILAIAGATETGTTGASTAATATESAETVSTGSAATSSTTTSSAGMSTGTKVAIGVGAVAAAGGGIALGIMAANKEETASFTGTFNSDNSRGNAQYHIQMYSLVENGTSVTGTYEFRGGHVNVDCTTYHLMTITGTLNSGQLVWSWPYREDCCSCYHLGTCCTRIEGGSYSATLSNNGDRLAVSGPACAYPDSGINPDYTCVGVSGFDPPFQRVKE